VSTLELDGRAVDEVGVERVVDVGGLVRLLVVAG